MIEWRSVVGFEGLYEVSNEGRVRSLDRVIKSRGGTRTIKGRVLKGGTHQFGYPLVTLVGKGRKVYRTVHSIVADAFLGLRPDGMEVRHLDGDVKNSRADNLKYGTHSENMQDTKMHGTYNGGEKHWCSILTKENVLEIRIRRTSGETLTNLSKHYGVSETAIHKAATRKTWKHL